MFKVFIRSVVIVSFLYQNILFAQDEYSQRASIILNRINDVSQFYEGDTTIQMWEDLSRVYRPDFTSLVLINDSFWAVTEDHIFRYDPHTGIIEKILEFDDFYTGKTPQGVLNLINGKIWGTASDGGIEGGGGIIYTIDPDGTNFEIIYHFRGGSSADAPYGGVILSGGRIWGTTRNGGNYTNEFGSRLGTIYSLKSDGTDFQIHHEFTTSEGNYPYGELLDINGTLWGQTKYYSSVFSIKNDGTEYTQHHKVTNTSIQGNDALSSLTYIDGKLWGTRSTGGGNGHGLVFTINQDGGNFQVIHEFDGTNGSNPFGQVIEYDGKVWGTTTKGGNEDWGVVYSMNPDGSDFTVIEHMGGLNGALSKCRLLPFEGKLWGLSQGGGIKGSGTMFSVDPTDDSFEVVYDFYEKTIELGSYLEEDLMEYNSKYYGLAEYGGKNDQGGVFQMDLDGSNYELLYSFDSAYSTSVNFIFQKNGKFYGTMTGLTPYRRSLMEYDVSTNEIRYFMDEMGQIKQCIEVDGDVFMIGAYNGTKGIYRIDFENETHERIMTFSSEMSETYFLTYWKEKLWGHVLGVGSTDGYVFSIDPEGTNYTTYTVEDDWYNEVNSLHVNSDCGLTIMGDKLWGVNSEGIFSVTETGVVNYEWMFDYTITGNAPVNRLKYYRGKLWGATLNGGDFGEGVIYSFQEGKDLQIEQHLELPVNFDGGLLVTGPPPVIWRDGAWSNGVGPSATDWVLVQDDLVVYAGKAFTCVGLEILPGVTVEVTTYIEVIGHLVNYGELSVHSGGSLITYEQYEYRGKPMTYSRTKAYDNAYSMMGTPFQYDMATTGQDLGSIVYLYDESLPYRLNVNDGLERWVSAKDEVLRPGNGLAVSGQTTITLTGKPNVGEIIVPDLTYTMDPTSTASEWGWHLVANPYTAAINLQSFLDANYDIKGFVALWDDGGSENGRRTNADYLIANKVGITYGPNRINFNGYLRSMQGFFVQLDGADGEVKFTEDMRVKYNNDSRYFLRTVSEIQTIRIAMTDADSMYSETLIGLLEDATFGIDRDYDANKLKAGEVHNIFTMAEGENLAIQGLPLYFDHYSVPIGIDSDRDKQIQLNFEISALTESAFDIMLHDLITDRYYAINEPIDLSVSKGIEQHHYELIISRKEILNVPDYDVKIYANHSQIVIQSDRETISQYRVMNLMGQELAHEQLPDPKNVYTLKSLRSGLYIIQIGLGKGIVVTKKVFISED